MYTNLFFLPSTMNLPFFVLCLYLQKYTETHKMSVLFINIITQ